MNSWQEARLLTAMANLLLAMNDEAEPQVVDELTEVADRLDAIARHLRERKA